MQRLSKTGKVYLVGAGPGDPSLLTLKGLWCLQEADVVVYDRLVGEYLLALCREDAELIYVGKATGHHALPQEEINRLLVEQAAAGKVVCRLKGGDPFVFGRGGEEAAELAKAGIPFEIVPGVTAAVAAPAYAGIPVTHRDFASAFMVATGHRRKEADGGAEAGGPFPPAAGCTAVFLMGYENLRAIVRSLLAGGWSKDTPAALVYWGTRAEQKAVTGALADIEERAREAKIGPPSILIAGRVVDLKKLLGWRERQPLFGKRILITRALRQAHGFARKIMQLGGEPVCLPAIALVPPEDYAPLDDALARLPEYDWVVFTSANGVNFFMQRLQELKIDIRKLRGEIAAIGPATAEAVSRFGLQVAYRPGEYRAEALLEGLGGMIPAGRRVLLPRAAEAREVLPEGLRSQGIRVEVVPVYRTVPAGAGYKAVVRELLGDGRIHIITFTSSSSVRNFASLFADEDMNRLLERSRVACIGPVTAGTARSLGMRVDIVAREYTVDGLLKSIAGEAGRADTP